MADSLFSSFKARLLFVGLLTFTAVLQVYAERGFGWPIALTDATITHFLLAFACLLINNVLQNYSPSHHLLVYLVVLSLVFTVLLLIPSYSLLSEVFNENEAYHQFLKQGLPIRFWLVFLVIGWMAMLSILWQNQQERHEQHQRRAEAEKLAKEAELHKLHQQLQPHFLFNSLNSIHALVRSRPEEARSMIQQLSDFLRGTLRKQDEEWVSLGEELKHLQLYLEIEKVRFGHRLSTCIDADESGAACHLPPMLMQPIVENAIKFGLYDTTEAVNIHIQAHMKEGMLHLSVQNPFDPRTAPLRQGAGFGLSGVQRRLYLLFARQDLLETRAQDHLFTTILKIPQRV